MDPNWLVCVTVLFPSSAIHFLSTTEEHSRLRWFCIHVGEGFTLLYIYRKREQLLKFYNLGKDKELESVKGICLF